MPASRQFTSSCSALAQRHRRALDGSRLASSLSTSDVSKTLKRTNSARSVTLAKHRYHPYLSASVDVGVAGHCDVPGRSADAGAQAVPVGLVGPGPVCGAPGCASWWGERHFADASDGEALPGNSLTENPGGPTATPRCPHARPRAPRRPAESNRTSPSEHQGSANVEQADRRYGIPLRRWLILRLATADLS